MTGLNEGYWRDDDRNERYLSVIKLLIASGADINGGRGANSEPSVTDMVLRNKNAEFMQQLREAVGMTKADNPTGGLTSQQITTTLTTTKLANLADLAPLIKSGDSSVRSRALDLVNELAGDEKIGGALDFFLAELERQGGGATKLLNREVFSPQLISAVILATDDPQSNVRIKALQAFRSIDEVEENIIKVVTNKLASDSEPGVKVAAAGTLVSFAMTQKQDMTTLVEKKLESALLQAKDAKARIGIAMALNFIHLQHRDATTKTSLNEASPTKVLTMEFGRAYDVPELEMKSTKVIPCYHDDHQQASYRFCMVLDSRQKAPNITIKLILPAKRTDWSFGHNFLVPGYDPVYVKGSDGTWEHGKFKSNGAVKVSADGKTGTYKNAFTQGARGVWGLYAASWPTDAETIPGKYRLEVYFNDKLEKAFDFELVKTKAKS
jgi:hypothetical protein